MIIKSAGLHPSEIHPLTHSFMNEVGIDLNGHHSKKIDMKTFFASTIVMKLCEEIKETCPVVPFGTRNVLWNIQDPLLGITPKLENVRLARDEMLPPISSSCCRPSKSMVFVQSTSLPPCLGPVQSAETEKVHGVFFMTCLIIYGRSSFWTVSCPKKTNICLGQHQVSHDFSLF